MRGSVGVGRLLMAGMLVWAAAGCSSVVEGAAEPASGQEGLFDPCKDIPDSVLEEVGLDPATEEAGAAGVEQPGWNICGWSGSWYFLTVYSSSYTVDDVRRNPDFRGFEELNVGGRRGIEYQRVDDEDNNGCYLAFSVEHGSIWFNVERKLSEARQESSCVVVQRLSVNLEPTLPK